MKHVSMSVDFVPVVVWTGIMDDIVTYVRLKEVQKMMNIFLVIFNSCEIICLKLRIWKMYKLMLIFTACQPGYYGTNCSLVCPSNCKTCRHTDGLCSCKAGWMGHNCTIGDYIDTLFLNQWYNLLCLCDATKVMNQFVCTMLKNNQAV